MFFSNPASLEKAILAALQSSQAFIEFTPTGEIVTANANFLASVGYALEDIQGRHHSFFCEPEIATSEQYVRFWRDLASGRHQTGEFRRRGNGGRDVWLQASYNPIQDKTGKVVKVVKVASDITAQKILDLDQSGKMAAIGRAQAIIEFTPTGQILAANENFLASMGYQQEEIIGRHHKMFCESTYADSADYRRFWDQLGSGQIQAGEFRRIGKAGREVFIQASYNPILDEDGRILKIVKFAIDVTMLVKKRRANESLSRDIDAELGAVVQRIVHASEISHSASTASTETGSIVSSVASACVELSASVGEVSRSMSNAKAGVEDVFKHAETATACADALNESATSMNSVVSLIQEIAGQINLLALNAAIESARAGDAGRGFAVVASEVKTLAGQAAKSTQTIAAQIASVQSVTGEVVAALEKICSSISSVLSDVTSVAGAIEQQNAVTGEISANMQAAVTAVTAIEQSLQSINDVFASVSKASENVKQSVEALVA